MTQNEKQTWKSVREKGCSRYVIYQGLVRHGIPFGLVFGLYQALRNVFSNTARESLLSIFASGALAAAFGVVFFGGVMGLYSWHRNEREYAKAANTSKRSP
jgi:hypothetical protein